MQIIENPTSSRSIDGRVYNLPNRNSGEAVSELIISATRWHHRSLTGSPSFAAIILGCWVTSLRVMKCLQWLWTWPPHRVTSWTTIVVFEQSGLTRTERERQVREPNQVLCQHGRRQCGLLHRRHSVWATAQRLFRKVSYLVVKCSHQKTQVMSQRWASSHSEETWNTVSQLRPRTVFSEEAPWASPVATPIDRLSYARDSAGPDVHTVTESSRYYKVDSISFSSYSCRHGNPELKHLYTPGWTPAGGGVGVQTP